MTNTPRRALLTGITGQDGSYLAELLLAKGYEVHGIIRRSSSFNTERLDHLYQDPHVPKRNLVLHYGDLNDASSLNRILRVATPHEIYNLGAQSHVKVSFDVPEYTAEVTAVGATRILEAIRELGLRPRFYQASSSEMFGKVTESPQTETTRFHPRSPYGVAKAYAYAITVNYREAYSPARLERNPLQPRIPAPRRDVRDAEDLARGRTHRDRSSGRRSISAISTRGATGDSRETSSRRCGSCSRRRSRATTSSRPGETHTVREFCDRAFARAGCPLRWTGSGAGETGVDRKSGAVRVRVDERYFRPAEVDVLLGDASKARRELGWTPKVTFEALVDMMVDADLEKARKEAAAVPSV